MKRVPGQKISQQIYEANRKVKRTRPGNLVKQAAEAVDTLGGVMSTRLQNIDRGLFVRLRKMDSEEKINIRIDMDKIEPFLKKTRKMSRNDAKDFDLARKNSDSIRMQELVKKYEME